MDEVSYADMFFCLRNHPEWQRDCGIRAPSDPLVLPLGKDNKANRGRPKRCCSTCSINQHCTHQDEVYQAETQRHKLLDLFGPPPEEQRGTRGGADSDLLEGRQAGPSAPPRTSELHTTLYPPLPDSDGDEEEPSTSASTLP